MFNDIINFGIVSYLLAIVTERGKWFLCFCTASRDRRFTGVSRATSYFFDRSLAKGIFGAAGALINEFNGR